LQVPVALMVPQKLRQLSDLTMKRHIWANCATKLAIAAENHPTVLAILQPQRGTLQVWRNQRQGGRPLAIKCGPPALVAIALLVVLLQMKQKLFGHWCSLN
jgi:negative regulator of sigma E activity